MVDVYPACQTLAISAEFCGILEAGWGEVFGLLKQRGIGEIADLPGLEVSLLDDGEMARIHGEFLQEASPTDVITFAHGELLVGVETARRQAREYGTSADREIALYGIHGMLHLAGHDDREPDEAKVMAARQDELFAEVFTPLFDKKTFF